MEGKKEVGKCVGITNIATPDGQFLHRCGVFRISLRRETSAALVTHKKTMMARTSALFNLI